MRKLTVFNSISPDGYFVDLNNSMSWALFSYLFMIRVPSIENSARIFYNIIA